MVKGWGGFIEGPTLKSQRNKKDVKNERSMVVKKIKGLINCHYQRCILRNKLMSQAWAIHDNASIN